MTPDTTPAPQSPDELEAEAKIYDNHGNHLFATELRKLADDLRAKQKTEGVKT